ncbi:hypothetical protein SEUCBS139899_010542 [Sporothrix eucalyptigena]
MKSINVLAQLFLASTVAAALCKPSAPPSSSSRDPAATYTPPASSSSHIDNEGGDSAATYYPPSSRPSFSPSPPVSPSSPAPQPSVSVSPCGQLIQDPEFALGTIVWDVVRTNGATLTFPGAAVCGGGVGGDGRTSCGQFSLNPTSETSEAVSVSQTINAHGAIVDGEKYQIYVQYRITANTMVESVMVTIDTDVDGGAKSFSH